MSNHMSLTEQMALCEAWKQSGLTKIKFCKENNIGKSNFYKWIKKFQSKGNKIANAENNTDDIKTDPIKFLKVCRTTLSRNFITDTCLLEISLANGITIKVTTSQDNINNFLQELLKWK